jgi:hypothetical protein
MRLLVNWPDHDKFDAVKLLDTVAVVGRGGTVIMTTSFWLGSLLTTQVLLLQPHRWYWDGIGRSLLSPH